MARLREYDYDEIAEKLLTWSEKKDTINLNDFCVNYLNPPMAPCQLIEMSKKDDKLSKSYSIAKSRCGVKREILNSTGELGNWAYSKNLNVYDPFLKHEIREEKEFDHELKKREIAQASMNLSDLKELLASGAIEQKD